MRLLFITQKVDKDDDVLGVYHRWLEKLAANFETIKVVCLFRGLVDLPANVEVYSLGKEDNFQFSIFKKIKYVIRFYHYTWKLRKDYDVVFIHMNPEYVILGGWLWKLFGKKIVFWYAHYLATAKLRIASFLADRIVTSTRLAYPMDSKKLIVLQQGIDVERFKPLKCQVSSIKFQVSRFKFKILFLGRIAPVKNLEVLLGAMALIKKKNPGILLSIVGGPTPGKPVEAKYFEKIKKIVNELNLDKNVEFRLPVPNHETPAIYNDHDLFVNLTDTGSFDKSTLEAMACGLPVIISNKAFLEIFSPTLIKMLIFKEKDEQDLSQKMAGFMTLGASERENIANAMRQIIARQHGLDQLVERLSEVLTF